MNIYVGNLPFDVTEEDLESAVKAFGQVTSARTITDRETGRPRGFGFVEMASTAEAQAAIAAMNGKDMKGRVLTVNEAKPRETNSRSSGPSRRW